MKFSLSIFTYFLSISLHSICLVQAKSGVEFNKSKIIDTSNLQKIDINLQLIREVIEAEILLHVKPATIWFLPPQFTDDDEEIETIMNFELNYLSSTTALINGDFDDTDHLRKHHIHLASFILIIVVPPTTDEIQIHTLMQKIKQNGNERKDRFIFIGQESTLELIFRNPVVLGLRSKIGVVTDRSVLFIEPTVYNPAGVISKIKNILERPFMYQMGCNLRGRHFKITGTLLPTWLYRTSKENSKEIKYDGSHYRMFFEASKRFNFSFELSAPLGQSYGNLLPNGSWTGMVANLFYRERNFDIAIVLGHVFSWFHFVDFAGNLYPVTLSFLTSPPQLEINWKAFFYPFQIPVWMSLGGIYLAISFVIFILLIGSKKDVALENSEQWSTWQKLQTSMLIPYSVAIEQNTRVPPSIRNLAAIWMIAVIITGTGYKCNLASYLSFPSITPIPSTYRQLAYRKDYNVILNNLGVAEKVFFETNESPIIKLIKKRMGFTPNPIECVTQALIQPKTVCISWTPMIIAFTAGALTLNPRLETLIPSKDYALPVSISVGFVKDSIFVDAFAPIITGIYETGIYGKWTKEVLYDLKLQGKEKVSKDIGSPVYNKLKEHELSISTLGAFKPFSLNNLQFSFYILAAGAFISVVIFSSELIICNFEKVNNAKVQINPPNRITNIATSNEKNAFIIVNSQLGKI